MKRMLEHIQVLDLSRLIPGAYCTQLLADLGARVLKVEEPGRGDYIRSLNPWVYKALNRNKRSLALDIKVPEGRQILLKLAAGNDVLLESFRPGVMDRLGLGYDAVSAGNPGIVYCSLSGYGQTGPYRLRSGHDLNYLAVAGVVGLTADPGELPRALPLPLADLAGSLMASHAVLAALLARDRTGRGVYIDAAMTDAAISLMSPRMAVAMGAGRMSRRELLRGGAYDIYRTGDGRFITLGVIEDKFWKNLVTALGKDELAEDPRFATDAARSEHREAVREILEPILLERGMDDWMGVFRKKDVPAAPVNSLDEVADDKQVRSRGIVFDMAEAIGGPTRSVDYPALFQGAVQMENRPAPALGADTGDVLHELGLTDEEIRALAEQGVVATQTRKGESSWR